MEVAKEQSRAAPREESWKIFPNQNGLSFFIAFQFVPNPSRFIRPFLEPKEIMLEPKEVILWVSSSTRSHLFSRMLSARSTLGRLVHTSVSSFAAD